MNIKTKAQRELDKALAERGLTPGAKPMKKKHLKKALKKKTKK